MAHLTWRIVGASAIGTSHIRAGTECQDANLGRVTTGGVAMAAVADGLGSAALAHVGARRAVVAVLDALTEQLGASPLPKRAELGQSLTAMMTEAFAAARAVLERYAADQKVPLRELGTTLLAAACGPDWLVTGHIGDGAIFGYWGENDLRTVSKPERGEYANVTMPLTMDGAMEHVRPEYRPGAPLAVVLMSDGLQSLALNTRDDTPFEGFLRPLIEAVNRIDDDDKAKQSLTEFLESDRVNARTDDDKTVVVICRVATNTPAASMTARAVSSSALAVLPEPLSLAESTAAAPQQADISSWSPPATDSPRLRPPIPIKPSEGKPPSILEAEQLEQNALELDEQARQLEEKARQLFAIDQKQFNNAKKIRSDAQAKRKKATGLRQKADKLRGTRR